MKSYSIIINTCDKFEDCWDPFFQLWSTYWKDCQGKIYLNTEFGSLYIPFDAIKNNDFSLIEERMTDYFSWYYGNNENESYLNAIKPLESKEAIFLKELLTKN